MLLCKMTVTTEWKWNVTCSPPALLLCPCYEMYIGVYTETPTYCVCRTIQMPVFISLYYFTVKQPKQIKTDDEQV